MLSIFEFAMRLGLALSLGAVIGVERQWRQKSAGLRTNTLVSVGAAAFILLSMSLTGVSGDPSRVASQIVTGIGFLGAGVIMKDGMTVQGLNTAATIWCSAAVGCLSGVGLWKEAMITTLAILLTHLLFRPLGIKLSKLPQVRSATTQTDYLFTVRCKQEVENQIRLMLMQYLAHDDRILLRSLSSNDKEDPAISVVSAEITVDSQRDTLMEQIASHITIQPGILKVKWEVVGQQADL